MMIVPAGSLVTKSTSCFFRLGGSSFGWPVSGWSSGGNAAVTDDVDPLGAGPTAPGGRIASGSLIARDGAPLAAGGGCWGSSWRPYPTGRCVSKKPVGGGSGGSSSG